MFNPPPEMKVFPVLLKFSWKKNWTFAVVHYFTWKLEIVSSYLWMIIVTLTKNRLEVNMAICFWEQFLKCIFGGEQFLKIWFLREHFEKAVLKIYFQWEPIWKYTFDVVNLKMCFLREPFFKKIFFFHNIFLQ